MADIINRLLLDTSNFDAKLSNSKKGVNDYQNGVMSMAKTAGAGIMAFAGTIGVAVGASEAFVKTINSSQTTGDAWVKMQDEMKASVDSFFASIAMGNFDGFLSNLQNVIDKAGDLSTALDNLGTKTLFNNSEVNDLNTKYQIELNRAKARNISDKERNEHLQKANGYLSEMMQLQTSLASANKETSYVALQADMAKQGFNRNISKDVWDYLLKDSNRGDIDKRAATYTGKISNYENKIANSRKFDTHLETFVDTPETFRLKEQLADYKSNPKNDFNRMASVFVQLADDEKSAIASAMKMRATANSLNLSISQKELEIANTDAKINGSFNSQSKGSKVENSTSLPTGSIAELNEQISVKNKELINATTTQARVAVQQTINELEARKINLNISMKKEMFKAEHGESKLPNSSNSLMSEMAGITNSTDLKGLKLPKFQSPIKAKDVNLLEKYQDNLYGIGDAMRFMSDATDGGAASWLNWGASLLQSIADAIPAIRALIPALAAKAAGEAASSAAQIPLVGWLAAGGAALSIISLFSNFPKFAEGGVFQGNSTFGDLNLARVNAGEMILNGTQQSNLFKLLDGGFSATADKGSQVAFRIQGKDLVGVLSNYDSQKSKVR